MKSSLVDKSCSSYLFSVEKYATVLWRLLKRFMLLEGNWINEKFSLIYLWQLLHDSRKFHSPQINQIWSNNYAHNEDFLTSKWKSLNGNVRTLKSCIIEVNGSENALKIFHDCLSKKKKLSLYSIDAADQTQSLQDLRQIGKNFPFFPIVFHSISTLCCQGLNKWTKFIRLSIITVEIHSLFLPHHSLLISHCPMIEMWCYVCA